MRHRFFQNPAQTTCASLTQQTSHRRTTSREEKKKITTSPTHFYLWQRSIFRTIYTQQQQQKPLFRTEGIRRGPPIGNALLRIFSLKKKNKPAHAILMHLWSNTSGANELMVIHIPVAPLTSFAVALLLWLCRHALIHTRSGKTRRKWRAFQEKNLPSVWMCTHKLSWYNRIKDTYLLYRTRSCITAL